MAERLKALVLKTSIGKPIQGSNPCLSAIFFMRNSMYNFFMNKGRRQIEETQELKIKNGSRKKTWKSLFISLIVIAVSSGVIVGIVIGITKAKALQ